MENMSAHQILPQHILNLIIEYSPSMVMDIKSSIVYNKFGIFNKIGVTPIFFQLF